MSTSSSPSSPSASSTGALPPDALTQSAYQHCARLAIGMLTERGGLSPQLFFVGTPARGNDASTSRVALAGEQALAAFHTSDAGANKLAGFVRDALDAQHERGNALARQLGGVAAAVHACHALLPAHLELPSLADGTPAHTLDDGRSECLLISVYLPDGGGYNAYCPVARDAATGALRSAIAPLQPIERSTAH